MSFELEGKLIVKGNEVVVSDKFKKRELVIETSSEGSDGTVYTESIPFQLVQAKCDLLEDYNVGETVKVSFNMKGKPWINKEGVTKYFSNNDAWKLDNATVVDGGTAASAEPSQAASGKDLTGNLPF